MAKRSRTPPDDPLPPPALTMSRSAAATNITVRIDEGIRLWNTVLPGYARVGAGYAPITPGDIEGTHGGDPTHVYDEWDSYNLEMLRRMFSNVSVADEYSRFVGGSVVVSREGDGVGERLRRLATKFDEKISRLRSIHRRLELIDEPPEVSRAMEVAPTAAPVRRAAFIVHGHDGEARAATARVLQQLDVEPIILQEQPNKGRTVLVPHHSECDRFTRPLAWAAVHRFAGTTARASGERARR